MSLSRLIEIVLLRLPIEIKVFFSSSRSTKNCDEFFFISKAFVFNCFIPKTFGFSVLAPMHPCVFLTSSISLRDYISFHFRSVFLSISKMQSSIIHIFFSEFLLKVQILKSIQYVGLSAVRRVSVSGFFASPAIRRHNIRQKLGTGNVQSGTNRSCTTGTNCS